MKRLAIIGILCCLFGLTQADIRKSDLKILYVSGSSDLETVVTKQEPAILQKSIEERGAAFKNMLESYFKTVEMVDARDYLPAMSDNYDVTVFDGKPQPLEKEVKERNAEGRIVKRIPARYLPDDFDRPAVMLAEMGETLGRRIGLKSDWYCLCLRDDAHSFRAEHPIFKGPFPVKMTLHKEPTPEEALHYAYLIDGPLPDSVMMWKVQNFPDDGRRYRIGMVARPGGFEDSPEAEVISGGVCAKSLDAVAIGRHGNFFHWGFAASPKYMTEEAKTVLANAIVYISQFAGQTPIARKYNDGVATREYIREKRYLASRQALKDREEQNRTYAEAVEKAKKEIAAKQAKGETLTDEEKQYLNYTPPKEKQSYEEILKRYQKKLFDVFGTDEQAYQRYYDENHDYFYGNAEPYELLLDTDAKEWGIDNHDVRLLEKAIGLWERGEEVERARRVLERYTLCRFETAAEWRKWLEANRSRLFFTEAGGWLFMVNTRDNSVPGNDYRVRDNASNTVSTAFSGAPASEATDERNPVSWAATITPQANGNRLVTVRMKIHPGYHVYAKVADNDPFMALTLKFDMTDGTTVGDMQRTSPQQFNNAGTLVYKDEAVFQQEVSGSGAVTCTVEWQCCNSHNCLPPATQKLKLQ